MVGEVGRQRSLHRRQNKDNTTTTSFIITTTISIFIPTLIHWRYQVPTYTQDIYVKGVGNKCWNAWKITFLRYSTGELGMISELFSRRPFIKILFSHLTISISRFRIIIYFRKFPRNFREIFFKNFPGNPTFTPISLTHPPYHSPTPNISNCELTQNFKFTFLKNTFLVYFDVYFPHPSYIYYCTVVNL